MNAATSHLLEATHRDVDRLKRAVGAVLPVLANRYRASSAIENLNSVLRGYLFVQKRSEQVFIRLFRFHWNRRTRQWDRWKGSSAHELLTGEKVTDWLSKLGFSPGRTDAALAAL